MEILIIGILYVMFSVFVIRITKKIFKRFNKNIQGDSTEASNMVLTDKVLRTSDKNKYKTNIEIEKPQINSDDELISFTIEVSSNVQSNISENSANITKSNIYSPTIPHSIKRCNTNDAECWIPKGKLVNIAGIKIDNGMIYVGSKLPTQRSCSGQDNCLIDPSLKISKNNNYHNKNMPYWPSYSDISPQHRYRYLQWLAGGAKDPDVCTGHVFLYFYGLERRIFLEQSIEEAVDISDEIKRLLSIYGNNDSINCYFKKALSCAELLIQKEKPIPAVEISDSDNWEIPLNVLLYLGNKLKNDPIFNSDDLLIWFLNHPDTRLKAPATRLEKEFIALMKIRLDANNPNGRSMRVPKKLISPKYTASSNTFTVDLSSFIGNIPDVSNIKATITYIKKLADETIDDLDKLSCLFGRNPNSKGTLKALALLPSELTKEFGGDIANEIQSWIETKHRSQSSIIFFELIQKLTDHDGIRVTKGIHKDVQHIVNFLGWNLLPAHNEVIGSINPDMQILLLPLNNDCQAIESPSQDFLLALFELTLGAYIAHADHHVLPEEIEHLSKRVDDLSHLNKNERNRLHLYIKWLTIQKVSFAALKNKLKNIDESSKMSFANIAVAISAADGKIVSQEVKALEMVYQSMGLDKKKLFSDLHSMTKPDTHKSVTKETSKPLENAAIQLDMERIAATLHDTAKVSTLLASIFEDNISEIKSVEDDISVQNITPHTALDNIHTQLLQKLLEKNEWSRDEYQELASSLKLMPDGAIETINEWAFEVYDEAIIENDDQVIIYKELLNEGN